MVRPVTRSGTTPLHAEGLEAEDPAVVYVTEVSHVEGNRAYVFGGFYPRSKMRKAYIPDKKLLLDVEELPPESIDYYSAVLTNRNDLHQVIRLYTLLEHKFLLQGRRLQLYMEYKVEIQSCWECSILWEMR